MAKLHELLAVDANLRNQAEVTRKELTSTFVKKSHHFTKKVVTYKPLAEGQPEKTESQLDIQTSIEEELKWIGEKLAKAMDVGFQIDVANTQAKADIILENGTTLMGDVPATALLQLEHRLNDVMELVKHIPTLDPAKGFGQKPDPTEVPGTYKAREEVRTRTEKIVKPVVMYPATDKHPAQVQAISVDEVIGYLTTQEWSSLIHSSTKGKILDRVEELIRAVKKARSRANDLEVNTKGVAIGALLLDYAFAPVKGNE